MRARHLAFLSTLVLVGTWGCDTPPQDPVAPDDTRSDVRDLTRVFAQSEAANRKIRVILGHPDMAAQREVAEAARGQGVRVLHQYRRLPFTAMKVSENALPGLMRSGRVVSWSEDVPQDPALESGLPVIHAPEVRSLGFDGSGQAVAILDTGIDADHEFLGGRVVVQRCFSTPDPDEYEDTTLCPNGDVVDDNADIDIPACYDDQGENLCHHGTHVAGIAAGNGSGAANPVAPTGGVAPGADIIAIQIFTRFDGPGECGVFGVPPCVRTWPSDQLAGLDEVLVLSDTYPIAAANMSLGGGFFTEHCDDDPEIQPRAAAVNALLDANVATVIATGNRGRYAVSSPACISGAVAVGATTDADELADFTNAHPIMDLFAPGEAIVSSIGGNAYDEYDGTSMATPMVTGAFAVLRTILPTASVSRILRILKSTGVDISYNRGDDVTPRIDLLAAVNGAILGLPPDLTVDHETVTVYEGATALNTGTLEDVDGNGVVVAASVGAVTRDEAAGAWTWSFATTDGPAQSQTVTITATDDTGMSQEVTFDLTVNNVTPTLTVPDDHVTLIVEGGTLTVGVEFTDPGLHDDPFVAEVRCTRYSDWQPASVTVIDPAVLTGVLTAPCDYGDTSQSGEPPYGYYAVSVRLTDKDGAQRLTPLFVTVENEAPTVVLDVSDGVPVNGLTTFFAMPGDVLTFDADVTDPGSDDLSVLWDWGDGSTDSEVSLLDPAQPDPFRSPSMDPRNERFSASHAWASACSYGLSVTAADDDGGEGRADARVVVAGTSGRARGAGYWQTQARGNPGNGLDDATLACYLQIVGHMSAVFDEAVDASTPNAAARVLHPAGRIPMSELVDVQLLSAWLNFADGAFRWGEAVDADGDGIADTPFSTAVTAAEAVRLDPGASVSELEAQKDILEAINLMHGG